MIIRRRGKSKGNNFISQAVIVKNDKGEYIVKDEAERLEKSVNDTLKGGLIGGLVGRLAGLWVLSTAAKWVRRSAGSRTPAKLIEEIEHAEEIERKRVEEENERELRDIYNRTGNSFKL